MVVLVGPSLVKRLSARVGVVVQRAFSLFPSSATAKGHVSRKELGRQSKRSPSTSLVQQIALCMRPIDDGWLLESGPPPV